MRIELGGSGAIDDIVFARDCSAQIGDFVWNDLNRDGIQDENEPGLVGVRVELRNHLGELVGRTVSGQDGGYGFQDLCGGTYFLQVDTSTVERNFFPSDCDIGRDDRVDSDCVPAAVLLPSRTATDTSVDFGFNAPCSGSIGNFLWHDMDQDGIQGVDEPGLVDVKIDLFDGLGMLIGSATTGTNGVFTFSGLCAGTYSLEVDESTLPVNFEAGDCDVGGDDDLDNDCSPITLVLPTDFTQDASVDFGYVSPFSGVIGDFVFFDFDCDGFQDLDGFLAADSGLADVGLILRDNMNVVVQTTNSGNGFPNIHGYLGGNEVGRYRFTGLSDGVYFVSVDESTLPPGFVPSPCDPGIDDEIDNDCTDVMVVVDTSQGNVIEIFDFGYRPDPCGGFGCDRDFWKNNLDLWPAPFTPETLFEEVFKDNLVHNRTLFEILCFNGNGLNGLRREAVAALLNAAAGIDYALTVEQVIILFDDLFPGTNEETEELALYYNTLSIQNCPLDGR